MRCIKDENGKVLTEDAKIKERWQMYFFKLLNGEVMEDSRNGERESREMGLDPRLSEPVNKKVIKGTLRKMPNGKSDEPDQIPVEVLK